MSILPDSMALQLAIAISKSMLSSIARVYDTDEEKNPTSY